MVVGEADIVVGVVVGWLSDVLVPVEVRFNVREQVQHVWEHREGGVGSGGGIWCRSRLRAKVGWRYVLLDVAVMVLVVVSVLVGSSVDLVVVEWVVVVLAFSVGSVVVSLVGSFGICVFLTSLPLIVLITPVRTLCSMVGRGTNLSLCASLYRRVNSVKDLAIGSKSRRDGDVARRSIIALCSW